MESNLNSESVPVPQNKHDPAWKHCEMFKNGTRFELKCVYCGKVFKGGGIHRIKEHLAGQKGNAASCLRVQPDVRLSMQDSLREVVMKKRKKHKNDERVTEFDNNAVFVGCNDEVDELGNASNNEVSLDVIGQDCNEFEVVEEVVGKKGNGRKKKGRGACSGLGNPNVTVPISNSVRKASSSQVHLAIGKFFFDVGVPLDAVKSPYFQPMIDAISLQTDRVVGPSYNDLRSWILRSTIQEVRNDVDQCMSSWGKLGCSILVDEWVSGGGKTFVSFFVYGSQGTVFLRSADVSNMVHSEDSLFDLLKEAVEEVGVRNVVQVITSCEDRYIDAGKRLSDAYPTIFWTPCAAHCIDLMLEDISKIDWVSEILEQAKTISRFVYNNNAVLNMMRKHTFGVELVDLGHTPCSTDFLTLKRMVNVRHNLMSMVSSQEWMESQYTKKQDGITVLEYVDSQLFWVNCMLLTRLVDPLLRLLRIVASEKRPAMAYVNAGIYRAKEAIKQEFSDKKEYIIYWNIIDQQWEQLRHHPLLAAGFYLNPKFFYNTQGDLLLNIRSLVYDSVEKMLTDPKLQDKAMEEITSYQKGDGDFGRQLAVRARDTLIPAQWWSTYGGGCPTLSRLAARILSQTCSLIHSKRSRATFEQMHETKNCLERQRLTDLLFVQNNLCLRPMEQVNKEQDIVDPVSHENVSIPEDWITDSSVSSEGLESSNWMTVDPPLCNTLLLGPLVDDVRSLDAVFEDYEIFDVVRDIEV